jgi:O-glycosyl hydrolase
MGVLAAGLALACAAADTGPTVVVPDPSKVTIRRWQGFGCSLSWWAVFTDSWPARARQEACRRLFGRADDCLGWNVVRYNAGGTAPGAEAKRFRPGGKVQVTLDADGTFHPERDAGQIACLREAKRLGADAFELFVNAPPHWMLRNGDTHGGDNAGENLKSECEVEFARWVVEVAARVERASGVRFASLEPFNEPSAWWWRADKDGQEGCRILPATQARVLRALSDEMRKRRSRSIIACSDENEPHTGLNTLNFLVDPARGALDAGAIGRLNVHGYSGWEWQERLRNRADELGIQSVWMSEVSHREWENAGYVPNDMRCALPQTRAVVSDLNRLRPDAWIFWQAVEPLQFCVWYRFTYGLLQAAADTAVEWQGRTYQPGDFVVSKAFWAMMQISRFIRPGYRFIESGDFWSLAAVSPDGKRLVLVAHNDDKAGRALAFDLRRFGGAPKSAQAWRTMDDSGGVEWNCRRLPPQPIADGRLTTDIPPRSVTTYVVAVQDPRS